MGCEVTSRVSLTPQELNVVRGVVAGLSNKRIGAHLRITEGTVKAYLKRVRLKLGAPSRISVRIRLTDSPMGPLLRELFADGRMLSPQPPAAASHTLPA